VIECPAVKAGITYLFNKRGHGLINSNRVCCLKLIIAESIQGAKTDRGVNVIKDLADVSSLLAGWYLVIPVEEGGQEY
jgi:hypothetical protein